MYTRSQDAAREGGRASFFDSRFISNASGAAAGMVFGYLANFIISPTKKEREGNHTGLTTFTFKAQISADGGVTWKDAGDGKTSPLEITGLKSGRKIHLRITAANSGRESDPSAQYPAYINDTPPLPPEDVVMILSKGSARIEWGEVLGVAKYNLYRRERGKNWERIYSANALTLTQRILGFPLLTRCRLTTRTFTNIHRQI